MTFGLPPSITATQLLVVPKSMPMTLAISYSLFFSPSRPLSEAAEMLISLEDIGGVKPTTRSAAAETKRGLEHGHAAVDVQCLAGDVAGFLRREINAGRADIAAAAHLTDGTP